MATTCYFEETINNQDGGEKLDVEFGRSSFYSQCELKDGSIGEDSIYLIVNGTSVIMTREMARKFVNAIISVGHYHSLID